MAKTKQTKLRKAAIKWENASDNVKIARLYAFMPLIALALHQFLSANPMKWFVIFIIVSPIMLGVGFIALITYDFIWGLTKDE